MSIYVNIYIFKNSQISALLYVTSGSSSFHLNAALASLPYSLLTAAVRLTDFSQKTTVIY